MLTDDIVRSVRPGPRNQKLFDEKGLYLFLTPRGSRLWRFKYRFPPQTKGNTERCISLGIYPDVSLTQARERRDAARRDLANGLNPRLMRAPVDDGRDSGVMTDTIPAV